MGQVLLLLGTRKGLFVGRSYDDRRSWQWDAPMFAMQEIYSVAVDLRAERPRLLVGATSPHWGPQVFRSDDLGETWSETPGGAIRFDEDSGAALERVWQLRPSPHDDGVVYAGTEPSALFRSTDAGETFQIVRGLWDHPHRPTWVPGGGGQAIHTIVPHPTDPETVTVAMSTGGVYRTEDAGVSWRPFNRGIGAEFIPGETPEYGQCVHKIAVDAADPDRMYAQNHGGVYRTDDAGRSWHSIAAGLPADFGFPIVTHPHRSGTIFVFPLVADIERFPPGGKPAIWRSDDAGETWRETGPGLPPQAHTAVLRDAFCSDLADPLGLYVGTRHGAVWISDDEGSTWVEARSNLPDVLCVRAAHVPG
ncbi:WD40/YVTN/BNR-like repeat-containing protein [Aeromicrobium sp. CTD01-1L150]|uniref:WD40/YVTN/BNR-like repeat-containing protein n=1 Tax=Aeromicrobium sp. CTD01-1L150 TaxID=3341830 RepID=UPI0035C0F3F6